jgi:hypothetical protein
MKTKNTKAVEAGFRVIIKRSARQFGYDPNDWSESNLTAFAINNPVLLVPQLLAKFDSAAKSWCNGNNSGDAKVMEECEEACDLKRAQAEKVLSLFGIVCDYPGLYPCFKYKDQEYHNLKYLMENLKN